MSERGGGGEGKGKPAGKSDRKIGLWFACFSLLPFRFFCLLLIGKQNRVETSETEQNRERELVNHQKAISSVRQFCQPLFLLLWPFFLFLNFAQIWWPFSSFCFSLVIVVHTSNKTDCKVLQLHPQLFGKTDRKEEKEEENGINADTPLITRPTLTSGKNQTEHSRIYSFCKNKTTKKDWVAKPLPQQTTTTTTTDTDLLIRREPDRRD